MPMKDAYYFPHDSNAKDDPKIINMIEQHGPEAYGIYWILIETLRDQPEYKAPLNILPGLARRYNTTFDKMRSVVIAYDLFYISDDEYFFSLSLNRRMEAINQRRIKLSEAGKNGNKKRWSDRQAIATQSPGDRHPIARKVKESKVKEIKVNQTKLNNTYSEDFEQLWEMYLRKGSKKLAFVEYKKLSEDDKMAMRDHIPRYVEAKRNEVHYMKDFERYISTQTFHSAVVEKPRKNPFLLD